VRSAGCNGIHVKAESASDSLYHPGEELSGRLVLRFLQINSYRFRLAPWMFCLFGCIIASTSLSVLVGRF
jgi:hypothetical protein